MTTPSRLAALLIALCALPALAQDEMPALDDEQPAAPAGAPRAAPPADGPVIQAPGMAIIGDQESPLGLYIMPWRQSAAESGLDRPARLLEDQLMLLDPDVFRRQVEYHRALSEHLAKQGLGTPH
jgi:hypothetical protein